MCPRFSTIRQVLPSWLVIRSASTEPAKPAPTMRKSNICNPLCHLSWHPSALCPLPSVLTVRGLPLVFLVQIVRQTSKHLRLCPTMHWNVIPTEMQATRTERPVWLDPAIQNMLEHFVQGLFQMRKFSSKQKA